MKKEGESIALFFFSMISNILGKYFLFVESKTEANHFWKIYRDNFLIHSSKASPIDLGKTLLKLRQTAKIHKEQFVKINFECAFLYMN